MNNPLSHSAEKNRLQNPLFQVQALHALEQVFAYSRLSLILLGGIAITSAAGSGCTDPESPD